MRDFRSLRVWKEAHTLTLSVYAATAGFPREELYGLTSQLRRGAASVPANIAESCGRESSPDRARLLHIAMGSACELEYHLILTHDLRLLEDSEYENLNRGVVDVKRMPSGLIKNLRGTKRGRSSGGPRTRVRSSRP